MVGSPTLVTSMADTIDKRVDVKLAGIREVQALHTTRSSKLETRFNDLERKADEIIAKLEEVLRRLPPRA